MAEAVRILGIDPGLRCTGWGLIKKQGSLLSFIASGSITSRDTDTLSERLVSLHKGLFEVIRAWQPNETAVEKTFVSKDATGALKLGQARGVLMLTCGLAELSVAEYAPNVVKKSVVGSGHADKAQMRAMLKILLKGATWDSHDAADALSIAITHAHYRTVAFLSLSRESASSQKRTLV